MTEALTYHDFLKRYNAIPRGYHACPATLNGIFVGVNIISSYEGDFMASLRTESRTWNFASSVFSYDELILMAKLAATLPEFRGTIMQIHCNWCGTVLEKGDRYLEHQGLGFCSMECATDCVMSDVELLEKVVGEDDRF